MAETSIDAFKAKDTRFVVDWLKSKGLHKLCSVFEAFLKCAHNRTVSLAWSCRQEHKAMKQCMNEFYRKANFKKYKHEYLKTVKEGSKSR